MAYPTVRAPSPAVAALAALPDPGPSATLRAVSDWHVARALVAAGGNKTAAARALGVDTKTVWLRIGGIEDRARRGAALAPQAAE